jgi:serine/threonine protein kinase
LVCELLRANLYEFQKYNREQGNEPYFTLARVQKIARQVLHSLAFLHSLGLIHSDLKPENILIKSYSRCARLHQSVGKGPNMCLNNREDSLLRVCLLSESILTKNPCRSVIAP